jgi:hypothetical protein
MPVDPVPPFDSRLDPSGHGPKRTGRGGADQAGQEPLPEAPEQVRCARVPENLIEHLAHDLRQPLSTIESIAYYLQIVVSKQDERVQLQLARLRAMVAETNRILAAAGNSISTPPAGESGKAGRASAAQAGFADTTAAT